MRVVRRVWIVERRGTVLTLVDNLALAAFLEDGYTWWFLAWATLR